jgi:hypothetical protein
MLTIPIMFFASEAEVILTFEEQDIFALQFQYLTLDNQDNEFLLPPFTQLTFENQSELSYNIQQLTFENQNIGAL